MNKELPKAYEPQQYEDAIYKRWEDSGYFTPEACPPWVDNPDSREPYSIMMPPPNVTGVLHLGHALENTLMDVMARYQRMNGKKVLLLPGTDHAAVATQARVEKNLVEAGMKNPRLELGREGLLEKIREYAEQSKTTILSQIKKMGTSADWSRLAYTFDEERSKIVNIVFKKMYDDGLIYRGYRVVNWSVKGQSTSSDDELAYIERKSKLYTFKYSESFPIPIATTRPETKLGDTAVAVHPEGRWKEYVGQEFVIENFGQAGHTLRLKIIADENVDDSFGTGALGVTTAHSPIDFEMYLKQKALGNDIGLIQVIGKDGLMTKEAGTKYEGKTVEEAREQVVDWLRAEGLLIEEQEIDQSVATSDRFGDIIESIPMTQWFVDVNKEIPGRGKSLKELMREAVTIGLDGNAKKKTIVNPERFEKSYLAWVDNLYDWCISRQIWWGHRVPVWYCQGAKNKEQGTTCQYVVTSEKLKACPECGGNIAQDEDTLDTWFSSGMWPFATLGGPEHKDFKTFFPTSWMQMGYEIVSLWMARMILFSAYLFNDIPFKDAYVHGILRDKDGRKFSKSLKNGIDPLDVIKEYGTDALRFSLMVGVAPGNDSRFYMEKVEAGRNLVNKLWNMSRFMLMTVDKEQGTMNKPVRRRGGDQVRPEAKTLADQWILKKLDTLVTGVTKNLDSFDFSYAAESLRDFTWNDLADWYLEIAKIEGGKAEVLNYILNTLLKLWHPYTPFVTEAIWQEVYGEEQLLMVAPWPTIQRSEDVIGTEEQFELMKRIVTGVRNLRSEYNIEPAKKVAVTISAGKQIELLQKNVEILKGMARLENCTIEKTIAKPDGAVGFIESEVEVFMDLSGSVDLEKEKERIQKEIALIEPYVISLEKKLANDEFVNNAPAAVVEGEKKKLEEAREKLKKLQEQLGVLTK